MFICDGHHDSDRIAVLVMVSKAGNIELYKSSRIMYTCQNKYLIHSFISLHRVAVFRSTQMCDNVSVNTGVNLCSVPFDTGVIICRYFCNSVTLCEWICRH